MPTAALATTGTTLTATEYNYLPRGLINYSNLVTANFTTTGTHTSYQDVTNLTVSVTYLASRILRVSIDVAPYASGGANNILYKIIRGSTDLKEWLFPQEVLSSSLGHGATLSYTFAGPSSGATETFKVQMRGTVNTAVSNAGSAAAPCRILVEDLGAQ